MGSQWGIRISVRGAAEAGGHRAGIPHRRGIHRQGSPCALVLGDNIFYGHDLAKDLRQSAREAEGARVFAYPVHDPERYGVVEFDAHGTRAQHRGKAEAAEVALRGHRSVFLRQPGRRDREVAEALARAANSRSPTSTGPT